MVPGVAQAVIRHAVPSGLDAAHKMRQPSNAPCQDSRSWTYPLDLCTSLRAWEWQLSAHHARCHASRRRSAYLSESGCSASPAGTALDAPYPTFESAGRLDVEGNIGLVLSLG